jgi:hypothetical protein
VSTARLKLREDAYWAASPAGAAFLTHQGLVTLTGASVAQWVDRLTPFLDGRHTLAQLTAALPPERRQRVEEIVTALLDRGVVRIVGGDDGDDDGGGGGPGLPTADVATYRAELEFLGYFRDAPATAFARYRASPTVLLGAGRLLPAVARAGLRSGLRALRVVVTSEVPTDTAALDACAELAGQPGRAQRLDWQAAGAGDIGEVAGALDGAALVVHACDAPAPVVQPGDDSALARARLLDRLCAERGIPLVQALADGAVVWLSPAGRVGTDGPGASDGWQRRAALKGLMPRSAKPGGTDAGTPEAGPAEPAADPATADPATAVADPATAATVVANQLVHDLFRYATGVRPPPRWAQLTHIDLDTLAGREHRFLAHPFSRPATAAGEAEFLGRVEELEAGQPLGAEEFSARAVACTDARLGVFGEITEGGFAQLPVHVCQVAVSDPVGLLGPAAPAPVVTGSGVDFAGARYQAALRALETYASLAVDPRRLVTRDGAGLPGPGGATPADPHADPFVELHAALARLRAGELEGWVRAFDVAARRPRLLPAGRVFPALTRRPGGPYRPPLGVAAAFSWAQAVEGGLVAHCRALSVADATAAEEVFPLVDIDTVPAGADLAWYLAMVAALGEPVTVHDVTGPLGVPTVACSLGGRTVAYGCAASTTGALADGLGRLLLAYQARADGEPGYAPDPVPDLPPPLRGSTPRPVASHLPLGVPALAAALARRGYHAEAVPLDHDPEVFRAMPYVAHVVVTAADG